MVGFSLITIYMTVAAALLAVSVSLFPANLAANHLGQQYKGITGLQTEKGSALNIGDFFSNAIFFNIVLSLAATVGLYFVASFLFVSSLVFACILSLNDFHSLNHGT